MTTSSTTSLGGITFDARSLMSLNKAVCTSSVSHTQLLVDPVKKPVKHNGQYQCVKHLRQNHTPEVAEKMNSPPHQKHKTILHDPIYQIGNRDQKQWCLDVIVIKNAIKISAEIPNPKIDQRIETNDAVEKISVSSPQKNPVSMPDFFPRIRPKETVRIMSRFGLIDAIDII